MNLLKLLVLFSCLFFIGCQEEFKSYDVSEFNAQLQERNDIETPEELITLYYNYPESEGVPNLEIEIKSTGENQYDITLIHDGLEDDSQRAIKVVMQASYSTEKWVVQSIKKNWKCWDGRGHTDWGIEYCN